MRKFISWVESGEEVYVVTDAEIKSERGKELVKESGNARDIFGHDFCRKYYNLQEKEGYDKEVNNFDFKKMHLKVRVLVKDLRKNFSEMFRIEGSLDVRGCDLKGVQLPQSIGGSLDASGCDLKGVQLPQSIGGYLDVRGCDLKGVQLPQSIEYSLDVSGCDLKGVRIPENLKGKMIVTQ